MSFEASGTWTWEATGSFLGNDADDDAEEDGGDKHHFSNKDSAIFLIDANPTMFKKNAQGVSNFELSLKCVVDAYSNKIVHADSDFVSIVFFFTAKSQNVNDHNNIYTFQSLGPLSATRIQEIQNLIDPESVDEIDFDFESSIGSSTTCSLSETLWTCSTMFSDSTLKVGSKRIFIFTNQDNPCADSDSYHKAIKKSEDIRDLGVEFELLHFQKEGGDSFNLSTFYSDLLKLDEGMVEDFPKAADNMKNIQERMRSKQFKKRCQMKIPWVLGDDVQLGVQFYKLVSVTPKPQSIWLESSTNEPVKTVTAYYCSETGGLVRGSEKVKKTMYGGKEVVFSQEEIKAIKKYSDPGLVLMGFKDCSFLKRKYALRPPDFMYPDESVIEGSTVLFNALLEQCIDMNKYPICRLTSRAGSPPKFVCLIPQLEERDEANVQTISAGFHVIYLPFADDIRDINYEDSETCSLEQSAAMVKIVEKFADEQPFDPLLIDNPTLLHHFGLVDAYALNKDAPEDIDDKTLPNKDVIDEEGKDLISAWNELVYGDFDPTAAITTTAKRPASGTPKAAKQVKVDPELKAHFHDLHINNKLAKTTVADLKEFLGAIGEKVGGKKADLISRIENYFEKN